MKKILMVGLLLICGININAQEKASLEVERSLESPNPCGCVELSEVTNQHNTADIFNGMEKCIELKDFKKAAKLLDIARIYGSYDTSRVKDRSSHKIFLLIIAKMDIKLNQNKGDKERLFAYRDKLHKKGSEELKNLCKDIQKIGIPQYFPRYMIQNGMHAFIKKEGYGIVENFDSKKSWDEIFKSYLDCGE